MSDPGHLREAQHLAVRDVGDVGLAVEREQVVLAEREHVDVLDDHHLVVVDREEGLADDRLRVLSVALGQEVERLLHPLGGPDEALPLGLFADAGQQGPDRVLHGGFLAHRGSSKE